MGFETMKYTKFLKVETSTGKNVGNCNLCHNYFKKGEEFVVFYYYDLDSKIKSFKMCLECYISFLGERVGFEKMIKIINKYLVSKL
jgi:hypothetical protein